MPQSILTANRLTDGVVVWLDDTESWAERLDSASILDDAAVPSLLDTLQQRYANIAVDIRAISVDVVDDRPVPQARRERLRGVGPSVRPDLAATPSDKRWASGPLPEPPSATSSSPFAGINRYDEYDRQFLRDRAEQFRNQVTRGSGTISSAAARTLRRKVSLLTGSRSRSASACAGRPPRARPRWQTSPCKRDVRRACGWVTSGGNRSANILAGHRGARQRNRRTRKTSSTFRPCAGRSAGRRRYLL
jgi:hypothetical protein